jgi:hypothetical protein
MRIRISWSKGQVVARLLDNETGRRLMHTLPYRAHARVRDGAVVIALPVQAAGDNVGVNTGGGALLWYRAGDHALVVPHQTGATVAGAVPLGRLEHDPAALAALADGEAVLVSVLGE